MFPHAIAIGNIHSGTIAGKLNGVMPAHTPSGWRSDQLSMPPPTLSLCSPAQALRDAAGELDDLDPALDLAARVGEHFAVLARDRGGERRLIRLDQIFELE